jgi:hypothetical protein
MERYCSHKFAVRIFTFLHLKMIRAHFPARRRSDLKDRSSR